MKTLLNNFPLLNKKINGKELIYLDNAATSQKPQVVLDKLIEYYTEYNSNVHRGAHYMANKATEAFEAVRAKAKVFLGANAEKEIVFTSGTTHGINIISHGLAKIWLKAGDEIILSTMEHHSNIVPWQMAAEDSGAILKIIPLLENQQLNMQAYEQLLNEKTKIVTVVYVSNALGIINPVRDIIHLAHQYGALVVLDGAQSTAHFQIDVTALDTDFYVCSGHKILGPTGTGILYGKEKLLSLLPPLFGGGEMIREVSFAATTYNDSPYKFEAGTPNIGDIIALGTALDYLSTVGWETISHIENSLLSTATELMREIDSAILYGDVEDKVCLLSFNIDGIHPYDLGVLLDLEGIAIRTGHHCCQPLMHSLQIPGTCRASLSFYNTLEEIFRFYEVLRKIIPKLR